MFGKLMNIASEFEKKKKQLSITFPHVCRHKVFFNGFQCLKILFFATFSLKENLPDAGKAQDFMKKFNQVLGEDEKLRVQLEMLISPTCSCKQAEICVVS